MQPRGLLMIEHRLIERMIILIDKEIKKIENTQEVNHSFIDIAVDFIKTYADRTHHGKEEDILFSELSKKKLSPADMNLMQELIQEHILARATTTAIIEASAAHQKGDTAAISLIVEHLRKLVTFYPKHMEKEDQTFFPTSMTYFSDAEQQTMLEEFWEFDRKLIHEKYKSIIDSLEE